MLTLLGGLALGGYFLTPVMNQFQTTDVTISTVPDCSTGDPLYIIAMRMSIITDFKYEVYQFNDYIQFRGLALRLYDNRFPVFYGSITTSIHSFDPGYWLPLDNQTLIYYQCNQLPLQEG